MNLGRRPVVIMTLLVMLSGCATLPNGQRWGENATLTPGWDRVETAARKAVLAPQTWAPLAGAAVFRLTDWDGRVSSWAVNHHPVFGSTSNASSASDTLAYSSGAIWALTALATPSGESADPWLLNKVKGVAVQGSSIFAAQGMSEGLKRLTHRPRPDHSDNMSFPSGHATAVASFTTLSYRNLETLPLSDREKLAAGIGLGGMAVATGWARIESENHYPSDVLTGFAIGYFFSSFFNDAFLGLDDHAPLRSTLDLSSKGAVIGIAGSF